uniref:cadherin-related family member 2-like n=1 Tax=Monopterus albus TaxID=43700 RepID=UPI0009B32191|nr:cadherin-related family member 2-like [Monopterus albus]
MEETTRSVLLLCLLSLTNANSAPVINARAYPVCEATPKGVTAFKIDATDADNDPLTYTLSGTNAPYFKVIKNTGDVIVEKPLDREAGNVMNLDVVVSDGFSSTGEELTIILEDANDNKPIFENPSYDTEIKENTPVGTTLFKVHATDADTGTAGVVRYNIDEVIPKDGSSLFNITEITGAVILNGSLNYTSLGTSYRLKINATDGGGGCDKKKDPLSSVTFSIITVVDVPDLDPQFINLPYIGNVLEESSVGQSVLTVTALDQDTGINDAMIYSIEDSVPDGLFTISSEDGVISVLSPIDREAIGDTVNLTVKATESQLNINGVRASTTAKVQINIIDKNDNKPEFYECGGTEDKPSCVKASHFTGEVFENSVGLISFNMTVRDPDKDSQTELSLEGTDKDVFSVVPKSTLSDSKVQLQIKKPEKLDFEVQKQMVLQVIAIDQGKASFHLQLQ